MKLLLLCFALVLSLQGWCAVVAPSGRPARTATPNHNAIEKVQMEEEADRPLLLVAIVGCGLLAYLTVIVWWVIVAKNSLDKILKDVLQDMARCRVIP
jgi:hypothetical protein